MHFCTGLLKGKMKHTDHIRGLDCDLCSLNAFYFISHHPSAKVQYDLYGGFKIQAMYCGVTLHNMHYCCEGICVPLLFMITGITL